MRSVRWLETEAARSAMGSSVEINRSGSFDPPTTQCTSTFPFRPIFDPSMPFRGTLGIALDLLRGLKDRRQGLKPEHATYYIIMEQRREKESSCVEHRLQTTRSRYAGWYFHRRSFSPALAVDSRPGFISRSNRPNRPTAYLPQLPRCKPTCGSLCGQTTRTARPREHVALPVADRAGSVFISPIQGEVEHRVCSTAQARTAAGCTIETSVVRQGFLRAGTTSMLFPVRGQGLRVC